MIFKVALHESNLIRYMLYSIYFLLNISMAFLYRKHNFYNKNSGWCTRNNLDSYHQQGLLCVILEKIIWSCKICSFIFVTLLGMGNFTRWEDDLRFGRVAWWFIYPIISIFEKKMKNKENGGKLKPLFLLHCS